MEEAPSYTDTAGRPVEGTGLLLSQTLLKIADFQFSILGAVMEAFIKATSEILHLVANSSPAAAMTVIGFLLLLLTAGLIYQASKPGEPPHWIKALLFACLIFGILFSAAGPSLALYDKLTVVAKPTIKTISSDEIVDRLARNSRVYYAVRLIAYNNITERQSLSLEHVTKLGPQKQLYSFVADYDELKGRTVAQALDMVGNKRNYDRVTAIIFPLPPNSGAASTFYPANARGLLQVLGNVDAQMDVDRRFIKSTTFDEVQDADLKETKIETYRMEAFSQLYPRYCQVARKYFCDNNTPTRELIGQLYDDWHPLGFSQMNPPARPCSLQVDKFCAFDSWTKVKSDFRDHLGVRAFLIENLDVDTIPGRIMIDFNDPRNQRLPEIATQPQD